MLEYLSYCMKQKNEKKSEHEGEEEKEGRENARNRKSYRRVVHINDVDASHESREHN